MEEQLERFAVTPGVGQVFFTPEQLQAVGEAAGARGRVELNSFMQLIVHTDRADLERVQGRLRELGLGVYPVGPVVKNLHTCTFCMGERIEGLEDARRLDQLVAGAKVPFTLRVGFSGCQNNCGEALVREIGVVRMDGGAYDLYVGGKPGSLRPRFGERVAARVPAERLEEAITVILDTYRQTARGKERFWKNVDRLGAGEYQQALGVRGLGQG